MRLSSIRFQAKWREGVAENCRPAEFRLGRGPCGKTVTDLRMTPTAQGQQIDQLHDDGTAKTFFYQWRDIVGRIEAEFIQS